MLRSFAYAATAAELTRGADVPDGLGGAGARAVPRELSRDRGRRRCCLPARPRSSGCSRCSSSRRRSTSCATSSTTGRTGLESRSRVSSASCSRRRKRCDGRSRCEPARRARRARGRGRRRRARLPSGGAGGAGATKNTVLQGEAGGVEAELKDPAGLWEALLPKARLPLEYELEVEYPDGNTFTVRDPYSFLPTLGELDLHLAMEGRHENLYERLGAHVREIDGVVGTAFAVWAPNARSVSRRRRLQLVGRAPAPDALARRLRDLGAVRARGRRGDEVQVRDPHAGRTPAPEERTRSPSTRRCRRRTPRSSGRTSTSGRTSSGSRAVRNRIP